MKRRKHRYHSCGLGFRGRFITVFRHGLRVTFCEMCGTEMKVK